MSSRSLTKKSSSLEFIELIPASPPSLDTSPARGGEQPQEIRLRGEKGREKKEEVDGDDHGPTGAGPAQQQGGSRTQGAGGKRPTSFSRYSIMQPFERGKSLQEMFISHSPERTRSPDDLRREVGARFVHQRGSVRTNFDHSNSPTIWTGFVHWLNRKGREEAEFSLFCFHRKGRTRRFCKKIVKSRYFKVFMSLVAILNSIALCLYSPALNGDTKTINDIIAYTSIIFTLIYVVEVVLGIMAYTCILHPKGYLRRRWTMLDLAVILFGVLYVSMYSSEPLFAEVFACLMSLKLIKILSHFDSVKFILKVLVKLSVPLFYLSIFTILVMIFFALVGMQVFGGNLHGGCYSYYRTPGGRYKRILASQFPCKLDRHRVENTTLNLDIGVHSCPCGSCCQWWEEGPNSGLTSFDNIFVAFLTVFQVMTLEGWSGIFYLYESAVGVTYAWVYFLLVVIVGSVFILNLWIGVLTSVFIGVSDREERHGNIRRLKEKKRNDDDLHNYKEWLKRATELDLPSETGSIGRRPSIAGGVHWTTGDRTGSDSESEDEVGSIGQPPQVDENARSCKRWWYKSRVAVKAVMKSKAFYFFDLAVHAVNLIFLMTIHFPQIPEYDLVIRIINYMFSLWYITEVCLRIYIYGIKDFFTRKTVQSICTFCLLVLSILSLLWFIPHPFFNAFELNFIVNAIWSLKLILILRYTSYWKAMKEILNTFFQVLNQTLSLISILAVFTLIFTTMGVRLFGERIRFQEEDYPNFDDFYKSFLLVFQLLTTEDWHNVFYSYIGPYRMQSRVLAGFIAFYFGAVIVIGSFMLISIFLAIAVDKLSEVKSLEEDTLEETEKLLERRKEREEQISALKNPNEPQIQRRTIRRVVKYLADNPAERVKQLHRSEALKKKRRRPLTFQLDLKRGSSLITPSGSAVDTHRSSYHRSTSDSAVISEKDSESYAALATSGAAGESFVATPPSGVSVRKQRNPLRLMKRTSGYFERQKMRLGGLPSSSASQQSIHSSVLSSVDSETSCSGDHDVSHKPQSASTAEDSVFEMQPHTIVRERQFSVVSTPESSKSHVHDHPLCVSYERTQSYPGSGVRTSDIESAASNGQTLDAIEEMDSPDLCEERDDKESGNNGSETEGKRSRMRKQDTIDRGDGDDAARSYSPSNLQLPADFPPQRLDRESSLEAIYQQPGSERRASQVAQSAKTKVKQKLTQIWEWMKEYSGTLVFNPAHELKEIPNHSSFFILAPDNRLRQFCFRLVRYQSFETISYTVILLSSLLLALEVPIGVPIGAPAEANALCSFQASVSSQYYIICMRGFTRTVCTLVVLTLNFVRREGWAIRHLWHIFFSP